MPNHKKDPIDNFWNKVDKCSENDCWNWKASKYLAGYGAFYVNRMKCLAHRFSYELHFGEIPKDLMVLHKCDNPSCVNPNHLFIGTHQDNMNDMVSKNRAGKSNAQLTEDQVREIKIRLGEGERPVDVAKDFPVERVAISAIKHGRAWASVLTVLLFLTGCGSVIDLVQAPTTSPQLTYQNPPRPTPVVPFNPTLKTMTEWQSRVNEGEVRPSGLVCLTHNDALELLAWMKSVTLWQKQALTAIEFHESQNVVPEQLDPGQ